jgi:hypothetical protein
MDAAYEVWAAYQAKFTGGMKPPRSRWDALMVQREAVLAMPFEDAAIEGAVAASALILRHIKKISETALPKVVQIEDGGE